MGDATQDATEGSSTPRTPRVGISGYWNLFREGYDELVKAIIRPPRAEYEIEELGPTRFDFAGVSFEREDLQLTNARGHALHCSMWRRPRDAAAITCCGWKVACSEFMCLCRSCTTSRCPP